LHFHQTFFSPLLAGKMVSSKTFAATSLVLGLAWCETLFVSHYDGQVYTLQLTNNSAGQYTLAQSSVITACGGLPSWLTYDAANSNLYCTDETMYGSASVSSFKASAQGVLSNTVKATTPYGGVANTLYGGSDGKGYIATAH
jgi:hypothetical protein